MAAIYLCKLCFPRIFQFLCFSKITVKRLHQHNYKKFTTGRYSITVMVIYTSILNKMYSNNNHWKFRGKSTLLWDAICLVTDRDECWHERAPGQASARDVTMVSGSWIPGQHGWGRHSWHQGLTGELAKRRAGHEILPQVHLVYVETRIANFNVVWLCVSGPLESWIHVV